MKTKRKGTRNEHRTMALLEAAGYSCTRSGDRAATASRYDHPSTHKAAQADRDRALRIGRCTRRYVTQRESYRRELMGWGSTSTFVGTGIGPARPAHTHHDKFLLVDSSEWNCSSRRQERLAQIVAATLRTHRNFPVELFQKHRAAQTQVSLLEK